MKIITVPGVNGLGKSTETKDAPGQIIQDLKNLIIEHITVDQGNVEEQEQIIYTQAQKQFATGEKLLFIGGDHSISYPILKAFSENWKKNTRLIVFDAHPDCMPPMKEPTHEEWLRALIEYGYPPEHILLIGTRVMDPEEDKYLLEKNIRSIGVGNITIHKTKAIETIHSFIKENDFYLSLDIDVIDSNIVSATSYPEQGGLGKEDITELLKVLTQRQNLRAADIVEYCPHKSNYEETLQIIKEIRDTLINNMKKE